MATATMTIEIELSEDKYLDVELIVNGSYGNHGIGSYEYWGFKGNDVQMGWEIDDWSWDESLYTAEENKFIAEYLLKKDDMIYNDFVKLVEND